MHHFRAFRHTSYFLLLLGLFVFGSPMAHADKKGVVIQVSDNDPATWNLALNVAENLPKLMGKDDNVEIEIVTFGRGLPMLKFDSEVGNRLKKAADSGVALLACEVTMGKMKLTEKDLYPVVKVIPAGVLEIMQKSQAGWFHIRP